MIGQLALEAEFRGMRTDELIVQLIAAAIEKDMVEVVLDKSRSESLEIEHLESAGSSSAVDAGGEGRAHNGHGSLGGNVRSSV